MKLPSSICTSSAVFAQSSVLEYSAAGVRKAALLTGVIICGAMPLADVTSYPFSLGWSEGNRLWDYSILFGSDRYIFPADQELTPFLDVGRQLSGGLPFLYPGLTILQERLWLGLSTLPGVLLSGHPSRRVPGILSVTFDGVEGESLLYALPGFAVSSGSACATTSGEPSYVLRALGRSDRLAQSTLRLSLGRFNTEADVDQAIEAITAAVTRLKSVAPGQGG